MAHWRSLLAPPRTAFHVVVGILGFLALWAGTLPGAPIFELVILAWLLIVGAVVWGLKLAVHLMRRRRGTASAGGRWFAVSPVGGLLVVLLLASGAAFELRWAVSQPSLERAVATAQADPVVAATGDSPRIGLYRFLGAPRVVGDAVFFYHPRGGGLFDDAGFAYLPDGLTPEVDGQFEALRVERIEGRWYRWWSSW